jgi:hypothetical protein
VQNRAGALSFAENLRAARAAAWADTLDEAKAAFRVAGERPRTNRVT